MYVCVCVCMCVCVCVCVCVCECVCECVCVCVCVWVWVCMCAHLSVCMYVRVKVYIYLHVPLGLDHPELCVWAPTNPMIVSLGIAPISHPQGICVVYMQHGMPSMRMCSVVTEHALKACTCIVYM